MNEKFALDPTACRNALELKYLLEKFGFSQGRFLVEYPAKWRKLLYQHIDTFPPVEQQKAKRFVEKARDRGLLPSGLPFDANQPWMSNAIAQKRQGQLTQVIGEAHPDALASTDVDDDVLGDSRSIRVLATAENLIRLAQPLLDASGEVVLIDPYVCLAKSSYLKVLSGMIAAVGQRPVRFVVFARAEHFIGKESPRTTAKRELLPMMKSGQQLAFFALNDLGNVHARYLLSLKGALKYDKGFGEEPRREVDIHAVSQTLHEEYVRLFIEGQHGHQVVEHFEIKASG